MFMTLYVACAGRTSTIVSSILQKYYDAALRQQTFTNDFWSFVEPTGCQFISLYSGKFFPVASSAIPGLPWLRSPERPGLQRYIAVTNRAPTEPVPEPVQLTSSLQAECGRLRVPSLRIRRLAYPTVNSAVSASLRDHHQ